MARMHSRKKGKAGSKRPIVTKPQPWLTYSSEEIEQLILKLSKSGKSNPVVGMMLRDTYGIPDIHKITGKKINKILKEHKAEQNLPEELSNLIKKEIKIIKHLDTNKKDMPSKRGLLLTGSKIRRLTKYYKRVGVLPADWKYSRDQIKLSA